MATKKKTNTRGTGRPAAKRGAKKKQPARLGYPAVVVLLAFLAVILGIFLYSSSAGLLGGPLHDFFFGLFSKVAYLLPPAVLGLAIYVGKKKSYDRLAVKAVLALLSLVLVGSMMQVFTKIEIPTRELYFYGVEGTGGGLLGGAFANLLQPLIGTFASFIIILFLLFVFLSVLFKVSFFSVIGSFISGVLGLRKEFEDVETIDAYEQGKKAKQKLEQKYVKKNKNASDLDFSIEAEQPKRKPRKKAEPAPVEQEPPEITEDLIEQRIDQIVFNPDLPLEEAAPAAPAAAENAAAPESSEAEPAAAEEPTQKAKKTTAAERAEIKEELDEAAATKREYVYPPLDLLKKPAAASADKRKEMYETANKLMDILKNFGVEAKLLQVTQGPTVTRYEIQPSTGVKLSKITGLAEDIALNLAVPTVLVAAVPGKAAVGIEVPNASVNTVSVRELLESDAFKNAKSKLAVAFGKDIGGNVVVGDIAKMPHVLIAGSTGSGKSVCINTIITSILYKASPDEVKLIMVDPKVVELGVYNGIPHLLIPVVTDPKRAAGALNWAVGEMMRRYALFAQTGCRNLEGYNKQMQKNGEETLPQIVIIIDELADLMMVAAKEVEDYVCRLAQLARAAGLHLIIATQRPSVDVITGLIKANVPSRIAFAVSSQVDSRTILDKGGAEKLLGKGDMLYHPTGLSSALRVQGAFVSDSEIENVVNFIKENSEVTHYSEDLADHIERCQTGENGVTDEKDEDGDELLPEAIDLAVELGQISTAMIQRRLKVGYARAGRIIDQMEQRGIISGANGSKPREVYMNRINLNDMDQEE